jgi:hypothetical protein
MKVKYQKMLGQKVFELVAKGVSTEEIGRYIYEYSKILESEEMRDLRDEANGK